MDRTMSDAEDTVRYWLGEEFGGPVTGSERDQFNAAVRGVLAELDAERAAHEATRIGSYSAETMANMVEERDRLKARLALAEAVCEAADSVRQMQPLPYALVEALAAWRAAK